MNLCEVPRRLICDTCTWDKNPEQCGHPCWAITDSDDCQICYLEGRVKELEENIQSYTLAMHKKTECMQKHFKQLCSKCKEYDRCKLYKSYFEAWVQLDKIASRLEGRKEG